MKSRALLLLAVLATAVLGSITAQAATVEVVIAGFQYAPSGKITRSPVSSAEITIPDGTPLSAPVVKAGDTLHFTNVDPVDHRVNYLSGPKSWPYKTVKALGGTASLSITALFPNGTYVYTCNIHPTMRGAFRKVAGATVDVNVINNQYVPSGRITSPTTADIPDGTPLSAPQVKIGDTIRWTNLDAAIHTATYQSGPFNWGTKSLPPSGGTASLTITGSFPKGTYVYKCTVHPSMRGAFKRV